MSNKEWKPGQFPSCLPTDKVKVTYTNGDIEDGPSDSFAWAGKAIKSWELVPNRVHGFVNIYPEYISPIYKDAEKAQVAANSNTLRIAVEVMEVVND